jgi:flagellar motor switch protein FliG
MAQLSPSLRKAAVLISSLDESAADAILQQMSSEDAAKVRSALMELDDIPSAEQQQVLADFLRQQGASNGLLAEAGVELDLDPAVEVRAGQVAVTLAQAAAAPVSETEPPLAFLEHIDPQSIAQLLRHEHPQTAAVVVGNLPPQQAAAVLQELPAALAMEALERIASIDAIAPEVMADLARALRRQFAPHLHLAKAGAASLAHLAAVLEAMDFRQRQRVVLQLGERNTTLLRKLGLYPAAISTASARVEMTAPRFRLDPPGLAPPPVTAREVLPAKPPADDDRWLTFDDLLLLSDAALRTVFAAADPELSLLALTGAEPRLIARILRKVPAREAAVLRQRFEHPGAVRLRDIEQARAALAAVANRLAHEGSIELPPNLRFAVAV